MYKCYSFYTWEKGNFKISNESYGIYQKYLN